MSNHLTSLAYKLDVGSLMRKSMLVLLADKASDDGTGIWASKQTMADELCCSKRAIINTLQDFMREGLLIEKGHRDHSNGYTVEYALDVRAIEAMPRVKRWAGDRATMFTGERGARVTGVHQGSERGAPKPSRTSPPAADKSAASPQGNLLLAGCESTPEEISKSGNDANGLGRESTPKEITPEAPKARTGTRLPDDWTPPPADTLPLTVQAVVKQWPKGAYEFAAAGFAAYWTAESGRRATKRDWKAAWVKWLTGESARVMAMARNGISFGASTSSQLTPPAVAAELGEMRSREDDRVATMRQHLRHDVGERAYDGWLTQVAFDILGGPGDWQVWIFAPSQFTADWVGQHFAPTIRARAQKVLDSAAVTIAVTVPKQ